MHFSKRKLLKETKATMLTTSIALGRGERKLSASSDSSTMPSTRGRASTEELIRKYEEARDESESV